MRLRNTLILVIALLALPLVAQAADYSPDTSEIVYQEDVELATYRVPNLGLTFQYPANWQTLQDPSFDFVLVVTEDETGTITEFVGLQSVKLRGEDSMTSYFEQFQSTYGGEVEEIQFGGMDALSLPLPPNEDGSQGLLVGFTPDPSQFALMIFSGQTANWDAFSEHIDAIRASAEITPLNIDAAALDAQMLANFEEEKVLRVGRSDAPVTLVEVLDFSCPHCADYATSIERVIQDYVATDQILLEFHIATFVGEDLSQAAAEAQYCAASLGYGWRAHEVLFDIHHTEGPQGYTTQNINAKISELEGVDADAFASCLAEGTYTELVERDAQYIRDAEVNGTPALLFGSGDETPALLRDGEGNPLGGGLRLSNVYDYLDFLLAEPAS